MLKIALCDNENLLLCEYSEIIKKLCKKNDIEYIADSYSNGYAVVENFDKYDLVFLDIDMPDLNGIETAKRINKLKGNLESPYIVFVSGKDNFVFDALKQFPYSFIRKTNFDEDIEDCILNINKKLEYKAAKYPIKTGRHTIFLSVDKINYIEKDKNYVIFHTAKTQYKERSNIDEKLRDLSSRGFIRTHIGYLVNMKYVEEITNSEVILLDGTSIPISKSYKQSVKDDYFNWVMRQND